MARLPKAYNLQSEYQIQVQCVQWFRMAYPNEIIYAVPNGGKRHLLEAVKFKASGVLSGVPDLFIALPKGRYHGLYIEMKSDKGTVSEKQQTMIDKLISKGYQVNVCYSFEEFEQTIKNYMGWRDAISR